MIAMLISLGEALMRHSMITQRRFELIGLLLRARASFGGVGGLW
jgi:hypothetical protein